MKSIASAHLPLGVSVVGTVTISSCTCTTRHHRHSVIILVSVLESHAGCIHTCLFHTHEVAEPRARYLCFTIWERSSTALCAQCPRMGVAYSASGHQHFGEHNIRSAGSTVAECIHVRGKGKRKGCHGLLPISCTSFLSSSLRRSQKDLRPPRAALGRGV